MYKVLHKQVLSFLNHKYGIVACFCGLLVLGVSAFHFGEVLLIWSKEKYSAVLITPLADNLRGISYQAQLCQYLPVDVVYTWVNGSDPSLLHELRRVTGGHGRSSSSSSSKRDSAQDVDCPFEHCLESHLVVVIPAFQLAITVDELRKSDPLFTEADKLTTSNFTALIADERFTLVSFASIQSARNCVSRGFLMLRGVNHTVRPAYLTSDWMSRDTVLLDDILILTGVPLKVSREEILEKIPSINRSLISKIFLFPLKRIVVVVAVSKTALEVLLRLEGSFTLADEEPTFYVANLVLRLPSDDSPYLIDDIGRNRFQDNEELRYSLRSLEKNAPWVRHVYIVTNGQIPSWLDLDNPRVTLVTHEDIFTDPTHLPTFSSPAIESHLHRISGLSKRFLYLNDDVLFGKEVWPEDFYTFARGQKVYLAWPVPDCRDGCPIGWISDGYCDKPCNNSDCQWDGGDCTGNSAADEKYLNFGLSYSHDLDVDEWQGSLQTLYCRLNCAALWIGDKFCDSACNVKECAYDGGDCGVENHHNMLEIHLQENRRIYSIATGISSLYFNLSDFLGSNGTVNRSHYEVLDGLSNTFQAVAMNEKFKTLTLLLGSTGNMAAAKVRFTINGFKHRRYFQFQFTLLVNGSRSLEKHKQTAFDIWRFKFPAAYKLKQASKTRIPLKLAVDRRTSGKERRLLDTFGDSLRHANRLLNSAFGYEARRVPAHMAHMFDRDIVEQLELRFADAFEETSAHALRSADDLQLAFAYFYFLMSERRPFDLDHVFGKFDTDGSGTLSDREIRTFLTRFYGLPITFKVTKYFEGIVTNCSALLPPEYSSGLTASQYDRYLDSRMPVITKDLVANCDPLLQLLREKTKHSRRYSYEIVGEEEVAFKMITTNVTQVVAQLDEIRAKPKKFICLNDNINHGHRDASIVKDVLRDFYESLFPLPSQFELPPVYRNRFLHVKELTEWRNRIERLRVVTYSSLALLILFTIVFLFDTKIVRAWKQTFYRTWNRRRTSTV